MGASDNVVRGGLTPKHVDTEALVDLLAPAGVDVAPMPGDGIDLGMRRYAPPVPEITLHRLEPGSRAMPAPHRDGSGARRGHRRHGGPHDGRRPGRAGRRPGRARPARRAGLVPGAGAGRRLVGHHRRRRLTPRARDRWPAVAACRARSTPVTRARSRPTCSARSWSTTAGSSASSRSRPTAAPTTPAATPTGGRPRAPR